MKTGDNHSIPEALRHLTDRNGTPFPLTKKVSDGPVSDVYNSTLADQIITVKIFKKNAISSEKIQRSIEVLKREGSLLTTVSFKKNEDFHSPAIVMPFFPGISLKTLISQANLSLAMKNNIAVSLLKELYALQLLNIVHCDLHPENILVDEHGVAKIVGFGSAQNKILNHHHEACKSSSYLAPECLTQSCTSQCNSLIDEYAMGVILAELYNISPKEEIPEEIFHIIRHLNDPDPTARAENIALANGAEKVFALKEVSQIQDSANDLRMLLINEAMSAELPKEVRFILEKHRDLSNIRNLLNALHKKPDIIQSFMHDIDDFCEKHARKIQHKNIIVDQGIQLTLEVVAELKKITVAQDFQEAIQLIHKIPGYPNVDLKEETKILDQLFVHMAKLNVNEKDFDKLMEYRDKIQNIEAILNPTPNKVH